MKNEIAIAGKFDPAQIKTADQGVRESKEIARAVGMVKAAGFKIADINKVVEKLLWHVRKTGEKIDELERKPGARTDLEPYESAFGRFLIVAEISDRTASHWQSVYTGYTDEQFREKIELLKQDGDVLALWDFYRRVGIGAHQAASEPGGKYRSIVVDPPWPVEKIEREARPRQREFDYPVMTVEQIAGLRDELLQIAEPSGCHVYLWFIQKYRREAFQVFDAWGVKDECFLTWVKNVGFTPFSWMYSTEHVLFGRIGDLPLLRKGCRLDFSGKVREHSRKPDEFYNLVCRVSPARRLDWFGREKREGFDLYGNVQFAATASY
jgi:N6-adenosine-specific RNA methylase IME4